MFDTVVTQIAAARSNLSQHFLASTAVCYTKFSMYKYTSKVSVLGSLNIGVYIPTTAVVGTARARTPAVITLLVDSCDGHRSLVTNMLWFQNFPSRMRCVFLSLGTKLVLEGAP